MEYMMKIDVNDGTVVFSMYQSLSVFHKYASIKVLSYNIIHFPTTPRKIKEHKIKMIETHSRSEYLSEEEDDAHSTTKLWSDRPTDHEVCSSTFNSPVSGDSTD